MDEVRWNIPVRYEDLEEYLERKYGAGQDIYEPFTTETFNDTDHELDKLTEEEYQQDHRRYLINQILYEINQTKNIKQ